MLGKTNESILSPKPWVMLVYSCHKTWSYLQPLNQQWTCFYIAEFARLLCVHICGFATWDLSAVKVELMCFLFEMGHTFLQQRSLSALAVARL